MGPRSKDRGNEKPPFHPIASGVCFNGAAIQGSRKSEAEYHHAPLNPLQWDRDPRIAEIAGNERARLRQGRFNGAAIQGSRKLSWWMRRRKRACASMGPRSKDRGNPIEPRHVTRLMQLQWGRDPRIAEISRTIRTSSMVVTLQWGRDPRIAEMNSPTRSMRSWPGFNGAAIQGSRKS